MNTKNRFQYTVATGRNTFPVAVLIALLVWGLTLQNWEDGYALIALFAGAFLLAELNTRFALIRTRTTLPATMFLLFGSTFPFLHTVSWACSLPILYIFLLHALFKSYESHSCYATIFHAFLALSLISLIIPQIIYLSIFLYLHMISLRSLNIRSFFAGIIGLITPYFLLSSFAVLFDNPEIFIPFANKLFAFSSIDYGGLSLHIYASWGVVFLLSLIGSFSYLTSRHKDKVKTRILLHIILIMQVWIIALFALQPQQAEYLLSLQIVNCSVLCSHLFALTYNLFTRIFFAATCVLWIALYVFNIWMP